MTKYESLLNDAEGENVEVVETSHFSGTRIKGLYINNHIAINTDMKTDREKICILAEELGHHATSYGNIIDQSSTFNRKQESIARIWAYNELIGLRGIVDCYNAGCQNTYEMADALDITETFLLEALFYYKEKYGVFTQIDNYIIYFSPNLGVYEIR